MTGLLRLSPEARRANRRSRLSLGGRDPIGPRVDPIARTYASRILQCLGWAMLITTGWSAGAHAAPFCISNQSVPPQCMYYDAAQCEKEAALQGGVCSANPQRLTLRPGIGQFCVVTSSLISLCVYSDRGSCIAEAARQHGTCVAAPNVAPSRSPDPYGATGVY